MQIRKRLNSWVMKMKVMMMSEFTIDYRKDRKVFGIKYIFQYAKQNEIELAQLFHFIPVYRRVGKVKSVLGFVWCNS